MQEFTDLEYVLIDLANNAPDSLDKETFEKRIDWAKANENKLWNISNTNAWKQKPLFIKAIIALEDALAGVPSGHLVGFDAAASGLQIMSVITGDESGCKATGLIDPTIRADAYSIITKAQSKILGSPVDQARIKVKQAAMTMAYGSEAQPESLYGKGTDELKAFYQAMNTIFPGACGMLKECLASWLPYADKHCWILPDGAEVEVKNYQRNEQNIVIDELNGSGFKYQWFDICGEKYSKKNAANIVHSIDAYILRSVYRRCNYNPTVISTAYQTLAEEQHNRRAMGGTTVNITAVTTNDTPFYKSLVNYNRSLVADTTILEFLDATKNKYVQCLTDRHLNKLLRLTVDIAEYAPFEIVTIHDDYKCHPSNVNALRKHYSSVLAELADSRILCDVLHQIAGMEPPIGSETKCNPGLSAKIRRSNYALS